MIKNILLSLLLFVIPATVTSPVSAKVSHSLPCVYRVEVDNNGNTRSDQARIGKFNYEYWRVWAEFDISSLAGKQIGDTGFRVYNDWLGTNISSLRYSENQPSVSTGATLHGQHTFLNKYNGFSWTIQTGDNWTPEPPDFFRPGIENWNSWRRGNGNSILEDLQDHIDTGKTWFGVEFDYYCVAGTCTRSNLRFPSDLGNPAAIVLEVVESEELIKEKNLGACVGPCGTCAAAGEPINMATGNEYRTETDLVLSGPGLPMRYARYYNSQNTISSTSGHGWTATFSDHIIVEPDIIKLYGADGNSTYFIDDGQGSFISETDHKRIIEAVTDGHQLLEPDGRVLLFDSNGLLTLISDRNNNTQTLSYDSGTLSSVLDNFGRRFSFSYDTNGKLATVTTPAGQFSYEVDVNNNLVRVTRPDTTFKLYQYGDPNDPHNLTGIINENDTLFATFSYDDQDRAISAEYAGNMFRVQVAYADSGINVATDSLGQNTTFNTLVSNGIARVGSTSGSGCGTCATSLKSTYKLDDRLQIEEETDPEGNLTTYTYDDRGNILTQTEAKGTTDERITTYIWDPDYNLITSITRGNRVVTLMYDNNGNLTQQTEQGSGISRTTSYTFTSSGQLAGIDGPRTDVADISTFSYYPNDPGTGLNRGMLREITNALNQKISFSNYNGYGKPGTIVESNNVGTSYIYNAAGRISSKTTAGHITSFTYDDVGNLSLLQLPGGIDISYTYTDANLPAKITDTLGNSIQYTYNTEGKRTREEIRTGSDSLKKYIDFEFDDVNRLSKTIYPAGEYETRSYDENNNLSRIIDPNSHTTDFTYDPLNRLTITSRPDSVVTAYGYDVYDNLTSLTDPGANTTDYAFDDLGRILTADSPDTGITTFTYDLDDTILSTTDGKGNTTDYQYDVLGRPTHILFSNPSENITYGYDSGSNGIGRLTSMVDPAGSTTYTYNNMGRITRESRVMNGVTYSTGYSYDNSHNLQSITYPGGLEVSYSRDGTGRITATDADGEALSSQINYLPYGPATDMSFGNNVLSISRVYDQRYLLTQNSAGTVLDYTYTRDAMGKVLSISGAENIIVSEGTTTYTHQANRLDTAAGQEPAQYSYDDNGNIISDGSRTFSYNLNNRLIRVDQGDTLLAEYAYDGQNRRVQKNVSGVTTCYHYDLAGNLISETAPDGTVLRDILYQDGERIAMKLYGAGAGIYYFINDHLGAPRTIINGSGQIVWQAAYFPFGKAQILVETIVNNFRFPGQYFDAETGLHYNWNRYYDPNTGRYITPDPIGLAGGVNLYAYVLNDPVNFVDPWGLVSAGQLGIGNPGSYGGENTCESMYDERSLEALDYYSDWLMPSPEEMMNMLPIGGISGKVSNIKRIATSKNIRKLRKLVEKWGGRGKDWRKMKGIDQNGQEWHWYQKRGDGTKYGVKPRGTDDPF